MDTRLHIACAIDDSFAYPLAVMMTSCMENNRQHRIKFHLFSAELSEQNILRFKELVNSRQQSFQFYRLEQEIFNDLPTNNRISRATYYRILIPGIIESSVEKYLYLDADIVVAGDIMPLFDLNMEDKITGAVNDISAIETNMHLKHNIPHKFLYFNAGVLLINKNKWIETDATNRVFNYLKQNQELCVFYDQDALNGTLYAERYTLSPVWNQQIGLYFSDKALIEKAYRDDPVKALREPVIIHFNGQEKPWNRVSGHPLNFQFRKYARVVRDFKYSEKFSFRKMIKRYVIYTLFGWGRVNRYYSNKAKSS